VFATILATAAAAAALASPTHVAASQLSMRPLLSGLSSPTYLTATRSQPNRLYIVEQPGMIRVVVNGKLRARPFLDIHQLVRAGGEQGLLSLAFHPRYARNHLFYVYYNDTSGDVRVFEYRSNGNVAIPSSARSLLRVDHREFPNHDGGQLQFGPDGLLYAGLGDGGSGGDPHDNGQNLNVKLAKLLRINPTRRGADWQIVGYGLRNPWRFSFDRANGNLWIGDVGQGAWEEIDFRPRSQLSRLANYGWSVFEGRARYKDTPQNTQGALVQPVFVYPHSQGCSVTGGYVYRGRAVPAARGRYFFGDYCSGRVWSGVLSRGTLRVRREPFLLGNLSSWGEDARGELYAVTLDGAVLKLAR
jgi:glucose/arabinose dehydrogenase